MKRGGPSHPKLYHLCDMLACRRPTAIGYLELLWHFAANYAPRGDIGRYSNRWIEGACDWKGKTGKLIDALVNSGYLDDVSMANKKSTREAGAGQEQGRSRAGAGQEQGRYKGVAPEELASYRLLVHDWDEHADEVVRKKLIRQNQWFIGKMTGRKSSQSTAERPPHGETVTGPPMPMPMPMPMPPPPGTSGHVDSQGNGDHASGNGRRRPNAILPKTGKFIREIFPDVDDRFLSRLLTDCRQAALETGNDAEVVTDAVILRTVQQCTKKNQESAGLYLTTVPACIRTWGKQQ